MNVFKPNIEFHYCYRDAGNFKLFGSVIFKKKNEINLNEVQEKIKSILIDGEYFLPDKWKISRFESFPYNPELDHEWYEFISLEFSNSECTDKRIFEDFLNEISKNKLNK